MFIVLFLGYNKYMRINFIDNFFFRNYRQKKKKIAVFNDNSAFNIDLAIKLDEFEREDFSIINEMIRSKTIVKVGFDDLYYLDEKKLLEKQLNRIKWAMIALIAIIILLFKKHI